MTSRIMPDQLAGRWKLQSWTAHRAGAAVSHPLGELAAGGLVCTSGGGMSVHITAGKTSALAPEDIGPGSHVHGATSYPSYLAYCGHYRVEDGVVIHDVQMSLFSNWVGTGQVWLCELLSEVLVLQTPPIAATGGDAEHELRWLHEE